MSNSNANVGVATGRASSAPVLVVMLKAPRVGTVKTRLAVDLGPERAVRIYRLLVERQMAAIPATWPVEVHFTPADAGAEMRDWLGPRPDLHPQAGGDLGRRLVFAVDAAFSRGAPAVLVIGGDCPGLDGMLLTAAAAALAGRDVVVGPAGDGGYYLIGLRRPCPALFADIPWSTAEVFATTLARAAACGLAPGILPVRHDVDTLADLRAHAADLLEDNGPARDHA